MQGRPRYGQYCPLSMAAEIMGTRWTLLILRELLEGSTSFNEISRGVPLMSRSLLSQRLKDLEAAGLLHHRDSGRGRTAAYELTEAGRALGGVVRSIAEWGQEWIDTEPSLDDVDTDFLMWDMRRNVRRPPNFPERFVVHFHFPDAAEKKTDHWLVMKTDEVDLCYIDPGFEIDVSIEAPIKDMTRVWMGWHPLEEAIERGVILVDGPPRYTRSVRTWLGLSSVSGIRKRPPEMRLLVAGAHRTPAR
ncbi:MAG: winged helix-turn-helix transcriptional regulator [Minwuia sp.]|uniref:winged helix-turn-helix transcriptional regulator n=1 Tax=Minwuia sp. TaxID=2493630 RepID=UPI003A8907D3